MVHKRDLYLILNQTDIPDCCIKLTIFQSFFFFSLYQVGWEKIPFHPLSRDFNTEISKSYEVPDQPFSHSFCAAYGKILQSEVISKRKT